MKALISLDNLLRKSKIYWFTVQPVFIINYNYYNFKIN